MVDQQTGRASQLKNAAGVGVAAMNCCYDTSPRLFLPLRRAVSVYPVELSSTIERGGIHLHPAILHQPADCPRAEQLWR